MDSLPWLLLAFFDIGASTQNGVLIKLYVSIISILLFPPYPSFTHAACSFRLAACNTLVVTCVAYTVIPAKRGA